MELFNFCLEIIEQEAEKFNVDIKKFNSANQITAATANDVNYDITHNRCAYLYRCGTINISFAKDCFTKFITEYSNLGPLLCKWNNCPNLTMSTFSKGPAFDYIAFLLAFYEYLPQTSLSLFKNINMISKYGAWRNTVTIMQQVIVEGYLKPLSQVTFENCKVIQGDPFDFFSEKIKDPISQSDVIMMIKSIKLTDSSNVQKISNAVKDLLDSLKSEAILFCIDTKPVTTLIDSVLSKFHGKYLLGPVFVNTILNFDCPDTFKNSFGCSPVISARGIFFVWQKLSGMPKVPVIYQTPKILEYQVLDSTNNSIESLNVKASCSKLSSTPCDETNFTINKAYCSASPYLPKISIEPKVNFTIIGDKKNMECSSEKSVGTGKQTYPSLISLRNGTDIYDHTNIKYDTVKENTDSCISFNKFVQTEEDGAETDSAKIVALTNKITKLTTTIKDLLQINELRSAFKEEIPRGLESKETSVPCCSANNLSGQCSFIQHKNSNHSCRMFCRKEYMNHCQNHGCRQVCLNRYSNHCSVSHHNDYNILRCCDSEHSKIDANQHSNRDTPNLVIPLSSLSKDFESLIISSLSKLD